MTKNDLNIDKKNIIELRYKSSKILFIIVTFIFFVNLYLVWLWNFKNISENIISPIYILLIITLNIFIFFSSLRLFLNKRKISYTISILFLLLSIFFILPVII